MSHPQNRLPGLHRSVRAGGPTGTPADYFRAFAAAGFAMEAFEEPILDREAAVDPVLLVRYRMYPYSFAVRLRRQA